jgi:hypothetical protein
MAPRFHDRPRGAAPRPRARRCGGEGKLRQPRGRELPDDLAAATPRARMAVVELRAGAAGWAPAAFGEPPRWRTHRTFLLLPGTHPIRPSGFALIRIASDGRASGGGGALASWEWQARRLRAESPRKCSDGIAGSGKQSADWPRCLVECICICEVRFLSKRY